MKLPAAFSLLFLPLFLATAAVAESKPKAAASAAAEVPASSPMAVALKKFMDAGKLSGAVTLVAKEGKVVNFEATGLRDIESGDAMSRDDLFWIASMTKPITAMAVMMLVEEGKLSIEDPVAKHLPEFAGQLLVKEKTAEQTVLVKPARPVTVKDLLTHTSGLVGTSPLDKEALDVLTLKEAVYTYALSPLQFEPGSKWSYCNPGINTLGRIVEVISGDSYSKFLDKRLFKPLGMGHTTFWPNKKEIKNLATSYKPKADGKGLEVAGIKYLSEPYSNEKRSALAAGGLFSTADDLLKLYSMVLNGGVAGGKRYLSEETLKRMTTNHTGDLKAGFTEGMGMGLGFQVVVTPAGVTAALNAGTFGHGGAHGTQGWIDPVSKTVYILLIQRAALGNGDASDIRGAFQCAAAELIK